MRKSSKPLYSLLGLVSEALQLGRGYFIDEAFLAFLWNLVLLYPYNNILQVTILKIFKSALADCGQQVRALFMASCQPYLLGLAKHHLTLLRQFIYSVWKEVRNLPGLSSSL